MIESKFSPIEEVQNIREVIKNIFNIELDISGGWGYDKESATIVHSYNDMDIEQFLHLFASIRANLEMNILQEEENRYAGINLTLLDRKKIILDTQDYDLFTFEISAMKESDYSKFIKDYKEGYGKESFNVSAHFEERKRSTIFREVDYWFQGELK